MSPRERPKSPKLRKEGSFGGYEAGRGAVHAEATANDVAVASRCFTVDYMYVCMYVCMYICMYVCKC